MQSDPIANLPDAQFLESVLVAFEQNVAINIVIYLFRYQSKSLSATNEQLSVRSALRRRKPVSDMLLVPRLHLSQQVARIASTRATFE